MSRLVIMFLVGAWVLPANAGSFRAAHQRYPKVRQALERHELSLKRAFSRAGAAWPIKGVFLRAHKLEGELELWAAPKNRKKRWVKVMTLPICAASGTLGPKKREGDLQVPEGVYRINRYNPWSRFHMSLGLNYPNKVDQVRSRSLNPGSDIFIHGDCVTVGCLPLRDKPMESLYAAAVLARDGGQRRIPVHIFPCKFGTVRCATARAKMKYRVHAPFWRQLQQIHRAFERTGKPPRVFEHPDGSYGL